jgi:hypothetical protein
MKLFSRFAFIGLFVATALSASAQRQVPTPSQAMAGQFNSVYTKILTMLKDFPEDKYNFRAAPGARTFKEIAIHTLSGMQFGANAAKDQNANWDEIDAAKFKGKADVVAAFEKALAAGSAAIKAMPDDYWTKTLFPWPLVNEHGGEGYGMLAVYFRLNGLVPPASRDK